MKKQVVKCTTMIMGFTIVVCKLRERQKGGRVRLSETEEEGVVFFSVVGVERVLNG
jgi:hypothetical protein